MIKFVVFTSIDCHAQTRIEHLCGLGDDKFYYLTINLDNSDSSFGFNTHISTGTDLTALTS